MAVTKFIAREQITISNSALNLDADGSGAILTDSNRSRIRYADVQVQSQDVRVTYDGSTAPVAATTGTLWHTGTEKRVWGMANIENIQFIREGGTDALIVINYWGE